MIIRQYAPDFSVYILSQDAEMGARIRLDLNQAKYSAFFFPDFEEMQQRIMSDPPHIVVVDQASLTIGLDEFFEKILQISSEIKVICLSESDHFMSLLNFQEYNLVQFFDRRSKNLSLQILTSVELISEGLYRLYQNEQLYRINEDQKNKIKQLSEKMEKEHAGPEVRPFQMRITEYKSAVSKEELLQSFFKQTPDQSWVFLKYIKSINTYISVSYQKMPETWVEGLSFKIPASEADFNSKIIIGNYPQSLQQYLKSKWEVDKIKILPLIIKNDVEGLLVSTQDILADTAEDFSLVSLIYSTLVSEAQPEFIDIEDSLTGFYNQLFYKRILDKEIDRSKRTFAPLSLIKVAIDAFPEIEISQGRNFCDEIIKKVADVIKNMSRLTDYICRTGDNEFSILLTNCNRKGAALRAERLRQQLKLEGFSKAGMVMSVSQGISEYPSLTKSAEALNDSARKALDFISSKGGDKICIYKAPQDHKPDFQVNS